MNNIATAEGKGWGNAAFWKWLLNLILSILTALAAALGTTSCVMQAA